MVAMNTACRAAVLPWAGLRSWLRRGKKAGGSVCTPDKRLWGGKAANEEKMSLSPRG